MHFDYSQHKQQGFTPIFILIGALIMVGVAGGAYYLGRTTSPKPELQNQVVTSSPQPSPSIDETANWKTYTSSDYKFSIKYPDFVVYKEKAFNDVTFYYKTDEEDVPKNKYDLPNYYVKGLGILSRTGLPEEAASLELPNRPQEEVQINNSQGVKIKDSIFDYYLSSESNDKYSLRLIYRGSTAYQTEDEIQERSRVYQQMLLTFKFIE